MLRWSIGVPCRGRAGGRWLGFALVIFLVSSSRPFAHRPPPLEEALGLGDTAGVQGPVSRDLFGCLRWSRTAALLVVGVAACGGASPGPSADSAPADATPAAAEKGTPVAVEKAPAATAPKGATQPAPAKLSAKERATKSFKPDEAKAQESAFRDDLDRGRKEVKAKRYAEGIAAYQAALKIAPNHPSALAELGWAAFLSGDLAVAERSTQRAIDSTGASDRTRGAALYNLGRIHEERGDKVAAATAYTRSLRLRENSVVAKRLAALEGEGASAEEKECELTRMEGPPPFDLCGWRYDDWIAISENGSYASERRKGYVQIGGAGSFCNRHRFWQS